MRQKQPDLWKLGFAIVTLIASAAIPLCVSALATAGVQRTKQSNPRISRPRLRDLRSIDQLKEVFQRDTGKLRIVALVSPT